MEIAKNTVVTLNYTVHDMDGNVVDDGESPLVYMHGGYDGIFSPIEEALHGKSIGENIKLKLQPEDTFGEYDEEMVMIEERSLFPDDIEVGMSFERVTDAGDDEMLYRITDIAEDKVVVDGNHPLAGVALVFDITVAEVRSATSEEISHGHVHGPGGHHH